MHSPLIQADRNRSGFSPSPQLKCTPTMSAFCQTTEQLRRGPSFEESIILKSLGNSISLVSLSLAPSAEIFSTEQKQINLFSCVISAVRTPIVCLVLTLRSISATADRLHRRFSTHSQTRLCPCFGIEPTRKPPSGSSPSTVRRTVSGTIDGISTFVPISARERFARTHLIWLRISSVTASAFDD